MILGGVPVTTDIELHKNKPEYGDREMGESTQKDKCSAKNVKKRNGKKKKRKRKRDTDK